MFIKCHYILSTIVGDLEKLIFDVLLFDVLFGGYFMSLFLSRVFYFIWQYSVDLGFFFWRIIDVLNKERENLHFGNIVKTR